MIDYGLFTACDEALDARDASRAYPAASSDGLIDWGEAFLVSLNREGVPPEECLRQMAHTFGIQMGMGIACCIEKVDDEHTRMALRLRQATLGAFLAGVDTTLRTWDYDFSS